MDRHLLWMALCCAIPLALIFALPYLGVTLSSGGWVLLIILLCPLMHLLMMRGHGDAHHKHEGKGGEVR